mmetsp:Transcript_27661/g.64928  ORF Transcript_27661/g.64928 Transcript_27661/m.64928 type:complete len:228 (+) Transcript_27661:220-903(+)
MEVALFVASLFDDTGNDGVDGNRRGDQETGRLHQHQAARDDCQPGFFPVAGGSVRHIPQQEPVRAPPLHLGARQDRNRSGGGHGGSPPGRGRLSASRLWNRQDEPDDPQDSQVLFEVSDGRGVGKQSVRSVRNEVGTPDGVGLVRCPPPGLDAHDASLMQCNAMDGCVRRNGQLETAHKTVLGLVCCGVHSARFHFSSLFFLGNIRTAVVLVVFPSLEILCNVTFTM